MSDSQGAVQQEIQIHCSDGQALAATVIRPEFETKAVIVFAAAMGVPRHFYSRLSNYLVRAGYATITFDYRGVGNSELTIPGTNAKMEDWGTLDIEAVLNEAKKQFHYMPLFLAGHSCGGQLFGLAAGSIHIDGLILVSTSLAYWKLWPAPMNFGLWLLFSSLVPALSWGRSTFPAQRLGLSSVNVPAGVTRQWASWARKQDYLFDPSFGLDISRYAQFTIPIQAWIFNDDRYAPAAAVNALLEKMPRTQIEKLEIDARACGLGSIGHFGFFRDGAQDVLWPGVIRWLEQQTAD